MNAGLLIKLGDLSLGVLIAFDDVARLKVTLKVFEGHAALLTLLDLCHVQLQLLHTVYLQVVL